MRAVSSGRVDTLAWILAARHGGQHQGEEHPHNHSDRAASAATSDNPTEQERGCTHPTGSGFSTVA